MQIHKKITIVITMYKYIAFCICYYL